MFNFENDVRYFAKKSIGSSGLLFAISVNPFIRGSPKAEKFCLVSGFN